MGRTPCVPTGRTPDSQIFVMVSCFVFLLWLQTLIGKTDISSPHFPVWYVTHSRHSAFAELNFIVLVARGNSTYSMLLTTDN